MPEGNEENQVDLTKLNESITALGEGQKQTLTVLGQIGTAFQSLVTRVESMGTEQKTKKPVEDKPVAKEPSSDDIDDMNNNQLMSHIFNKVEGVLEKALKPISEKIETVDTRTHTNDTRASINKAVEDHKDFWQWKDEMTKLSESHSTLGPEELYQLARGADSDKAKEVDEKLADDDNEGKDKDENKGKEPPFGGLTPTSGVHGKDDKTDMTYKDAAETAWNETMSGVSDEVIGNA